MVARQRDRLRLPHRGVRDDGGRRLLPQAREHLAGFVPDSGKRARAVGIGKAFVQHAVERARGQPAEPFGHMVGGRDRTLENDGPDARLVAPDVLHREPGPVRPPTSVNCGT